MIIEDCVRNFYALGCHGKARAAIRFGDMKLTRKTSVFAGLLLVAVLVVMLVRFVTGERKVPSGSSLKVLSDKVDVEIKDVLYTEIGDGDLKWEIKADAVRYVKKDNLAVFDNVTVRLITAEGRTFVMTGDKGEFKTDKKDIKVEGHVRVVTDQGDTFTTDHLSYANSEKKIYTDAPVTLEDYRIQISGHGMDLSVKNQNLSLLAKVRARIR